MISKKIFLSALGLLLVGSALISVNAVNAVNAQNNITVPDIVQRIAQRFNLNQSDVQKVFDEAHQEKRTQMQTKLEDRLNQAIKDGKITEAQKTAILNKLQEQKNNKPSIEQFKNQTPEQRKQAMQQKKTEFENWVKQNGLTLQTLQEILGHGGKGFWMGHGKMGMWR